MEKKEITQVFEIVPIFKQKNIIIVNYKLFFENIKRGRSMVNCRNCGTDITYERDRYRCPFCGVEGNEAYIVCPNCKAILTTSGYAWVCENCDNDGPSGYSG